MTPPSDPVTALILLALTLLIAAASAAWILRRAINAPVPDPMPEVQVYRDQLAELQRDFDLGRISQTALDSGRLEIGRRLAALQKAAPPTPGQTSGRLVLLGLAALVALVATALYLVTGRPGYGDQPFSARAQALLERDPASLTNEELIAVLQKDATEKPDDPRPHLFLGKVLSALDRDADALRAFQAAVRRDPRNVEAITEIGGTLVRLNEGKVGDDAVRAFRAVLTLEPNAVEPAYFLALGQWQNGDRTGALAAWRTIWDRLPPNSPDRQVLAARIAQALSVLDRGPGAGAADPGAMSAADRAAFVDTMVNARAARLAEAPSDLGLRLSLARVAVMVGDRNRATAVLEQGRAIHSGDPLATAIVDAATGGLLGPPPGAEPPAPPEPATPATP